MSGRTALGCLLLGLAAVIGCESTRGPQNLTPQPPPNPPAPFPVREGGARGFTLSEQRGDTDPRGFTPPSLVGKGAGGLGSDSPPPSHSGRAESGGLGPEEDDPLTLAAACLKQSDHAGAAKHLEVYVRAHPDQPMFRAQLAELYLRANKPADAKFHLEKFI